MSLENDISWQASEVQSPCDQTRIPVFRCGEGPALVLVHGWTLDHRSFAAQLPLAGELELVAFDRRGFGQSAAEPNMGAELEDIDAVIDAVGRERVHLLGVSQGARIALRYAAARSHRLASLIVQGVVIDGYVAPVEDEGAIPLQHYGELVCAGELDAMRRAWMEHPLMSSDPLDAEQRRSLEAMVQDYRGQDFLSSAPAAQALDLLAVLPELDVPTLVITGELETRARKAHAQKLTALMKNAREVTLHDCGHLSNLSRAGAYNELVARFIREHEAPSLSP